QEQFSSLLVLFSQQRGILPLGLDQSEMGSDVSYCQGTNGYVYSTLINNHSFIMSTPVNTSSTDSQMHNNIMAAGSKDRPPMLGPGRYSQWRSRFLLYIDMKPNDDIYSTVDACKTMNEMWIAIKRLQQGESLNVQDVKTNLFWEFGKFTSRDGESIESYYSWFYKLMNELTRNNLQVTKMQVNVQFLQQIQPEWSRFVTIVKQSEKIDIVITDCLTF
ncbi:hypothetical protein Tco_0669239, partial [Tanacetum coccineum]